MRFGPDSTASAQLACVQEGDLDALQALIAKDPDVVAERNPDKYCGRAIPRRPGHLLLLAAVGRWTPLMQAAFEGDLEAVEILLAAGADVAAVCKVSPPFRRVHLGLLRAWRNRVCSQWAAGWASRRHT